MGMPDFNVSGLTELSFITRMLVVGNPPICLKAQSEELILQLIGNCFVSSVVRI